MDLKREVEGEELRERLAANNANSINNDNSNN
jgi:hypothetical protein